VEDWRHGGFGLYIHWPFCQSKCPYCDFNSHVAARIDQRRWADAYLAEIDRLGAEVPGRVLNSVFFGGGTPSLMEPELVARVLEKVRATWVFANDIEITLEANPGSAEAGRFRGYREAGVNRLSMGLQALNDADLQRLGRLHSVAEAKAAFAIARDVFDRVSFDLIYARQHQTLAEWRGELAEALAMAADHLSLYQLTIEDGTAFGDRFKRGGLKGLPDEDLSADFFELTQEMCDAAGLPAYEVSNHAREGAESRHNRIYWMGGDYGGIGPGAHGRLTLGGVRCATEEARAPGDWLQRVAAGLGGQVRREALSAAERAAEYLLMGLRLRDGISLARHAAMGGQPLDFSGLQDNGLIVAEAGRLAATDRGRIVLNHVIRQLTGTAA
jgi:putative oxygen-independent coproporphyrinogen III oxidase